MYRLPYERTRNSILDPGLAPDFSLRLFKSVEAIAEKRSNHGIAERRVYIAVGPATPSSDLSIVLRINWAPGSSGLRDDTNPTKSASHS